MVDDHGPAHFRDERIGFHQDRTVCIHHDDQRIVIHQVECLFGRNELIVSRLLGLFGDGSQRIVVRSQHRINFLAHALGDPVNTQGCPKAVHIRVSVTHDKDLG